VNTCPSCGRENPAYSRFCNACGTELAVVEVAREQRKVDRVPGTKEDVAGGVQERARLAELGIEVRA